MSTETTISQSVPAPGLGIQSFYGFSEFGLDEDQSAAVNLANGNLVVRSNDLAINGPGIGLSMDRFYNGLSERSGAFGQRWSISGGQDVGLEIGTNEVVFRGPSGFRATFTKQSDGSYASPAGMNADLGRAGTSSWSNLELTYHRSGEKLVFNSGGYLLRQEDRNGNALTENYYHGNVIVSVTDAAGRVTSVAESDGQIQEITDPAGREITYTYNGDGDLASVTAADGTSTQYFYDSQRRLRGIVSGGDVYTHFTYDTQDRVKTVKRFLQRGSSLGQSAVTTFAYSSGQTVVTDPAGNQATYDIDTEGRVVATTDPLGRTHSQTWTANNAVATATDAMGGAGGPGNVTTYEYDAANNPTAVVLPTGAAARATYTTGGACGSTDTAHPHLAKCSSDAAGNQTSYAYDAAGNLLASRDTTNGPTGGREITYTYQDTNGEDCGGKPGQPCSATNGEGAVTTFSYDSDGNQTTVTPPTPLGPTSYTYDSIGRVTSSTDGKGQTTTYQYDTEDRLTHREYGNGVEVKYFYDPDGYLTQQIETNSAAGTIDYTYDTRGNTTSKTITVNGTQTTAMTMTYDIAGNLTTYTDDQGTVSYTYDDAHQVTTVTEPGGTCPTNGPIPDGDGCIRLTYDNNGAETGRNLPGGAAIATDRDNSGRPVRITLTDDDDDAVSDYSYSFTDPASQGPQADRANIHSRTDHRGIAAPAGSITTYTYDTLNRLTQAKETTVSSGVNAQWDYTYDLAGNRTSATTGSQTPTTWTYNAANQITTEDGQSSWNHDANGNVTRTGKGQYLHYNLRDQFTLSNGPTGYFSAEYLGATNAERTYSSEDGTYFDYVTSPLGLATQTTRKYGTVQGVKAITRLPDGTPVSIRDDNTGTVYLALDNLGSPTATTTETGDQGQLFAYDPYGNPRGGLGTLQIIGYAGGVDDPDGYTKFGARYYDSTTGRFTQMDPSGQETNPYLYAAGNPINYIDPTGLLTLSEGLAIAGGLVGFGALVATGVGAPLAVSAGLSAAGTGLTVGSEVAAGDTKGAIVAGSLGAVGGTFGAAGKLLAVSRKLGISVEAAYAGLSAGTLAVAN